MSEWREYSIIDFAEILNQHRIPLSSMQRASRQGRYPYYGASGIIDFVDDFIFEGDHVLVSEDGENLKSRQTPIAFMASGRFWVNNHAHILKGHKEFQNKLIIYYLQNLDLNPFLTGAVQPKLNKASLLSIPFYLPESETEQKTIASILSSLDDKIDLLHRQNATLEKMADTLFRQWFVKEARENLEMGTVSDIAIHSKNSIHPQRSPDELFSHYSIPAFDNDKNPVTELGIEIQSNKYSIPEYSILFSKLNPHKDKRIWLIQNEIKRNSICSTEFQVVLPKRELSLYFLYGWLSYAENYNEIASGVGGTSGSHQRIDPSTIFSFNCPFVADGTLESYNKLVKPIFGKILSNQTQIRTLTQLRDRLLPKLMSGEVRVETLEKVL